MRTIMLRNNLNFTPAYGEECKHFENALGYLSGWALASNNYTYVEISVHSNGDITACYWDKCTPRAAFILFAQRDPITHTYSFHS